MANTYVSVVGELQDRISATIFRLQSAARKLGTPEAAAACLQMLLAAEREVVIIIIFRGLGRADSGGHMAPITLKNIYQGLKLTHVARSVRNLKVKPMK